MTRSEASLPPNRTDPGRGALDSTSRARRHVRVPGRRCPRSWVERSPMESNRPTRKRLLTANLSVSQLFFSSTQMNSKVSMFECTEIQRHYFTVQVNVTFFWTLSFDATVLLNLSVRPYTCEASTFWISDLGSGAVGNARRKQLTSCFLYKLPWNFSSNVIKVVQTVKQQFT